MKRDKSRDFVAGRLDGTPGVEQKSGSDPAKKGSKYGARRLGLSSGPDPEVAEDKRPHSVLRKHEVPRLIGSAPRQLKPRRISPAPVVEPKAFDLSTLALEEKSEPTPRPIDILKFWKHGPQAMVLGLAFGCLLIMLVLWGVVGALDAGEAGPDTASAMDDPAPVRRSPVDRSIASNPGANGPRRPSRPRPRPRRTPPVLPRDVFRAPSTETQPAGGQPGAHPPAPPDQSGVPAPGGTAVPPTDTEKTPFREYIACPSGFRCAGIVEVPEGKLANINGKFLAVGDTINGAEVVEIRGFVVEMALDGKRFLLGSSARPAGTGGDERPDEEEEDESVPDEG